MNSDMRGLLQLRYGFIEAFKVYWERRLIIVFLMGFASGLPFLLSGATIVQAD